MASKKKKKDKQPSVPQAQQINTSDLKEPEMKYEPMTAADFRDYLQRAYETQIEYAPQVIDVQKKAQTELYNNMLGLQMASAPQYAAKEQELLNSYNPQFLENYNKQSANLGTLDSDISQMRDIAAKNLSYGYSLGDELSSEIEQSIRGAQTARGNWLGPAPTAQEAMGKGSAMIDLFNQRYDQYGQFLNSELGATGARQNFLQGQNPTDMMAKMGAATNMGQSFYPSQSYVDGGLGAQGFSSVGNQMSSYNSTLNSALSNYNQSYISAFSANNESMFGEYDRTADAWMYREAARNGLYSQPSVSGGGMGGMGSMIGAGIGAVGSIGGALIGGGGAAAAAGGIGAAASAAATALCWIAQKAIPSRWKEFRQWLCAEASPEFRRFYIFNGRRIAAHKLDNGAIERIAPLMTWILDNRATIRG